MGHVDLATNNCQGYFAKIWESQKFAKRKCPSSQIPFFTHKLLAEFGFKQLLPNLDHPNSSKLPNSVIRVTQITEYLVIRLFG
jgi:hypothetical protein